MRKSSRKDSTSVAASFLLGTPRPLPQHKAPGVTQAYQANLGVFRDMVTLEAQVSIGHDACVQWTLHLLQVEISLYLCQTYDGVGVTPHQAQRSPRLQLTCWKYLMDTTCVSASSASLATRFPPTCLLVSTDIYGAAHKWASLQSLFHDAVEIFGRLRQLKELGHTAREVLHGLQSVAPFQCFVRPVQPRRKGQSVPTGLRVCVKAWNRHGVPRIFICGTHWTPRHCHHENMLIRD